MLLIYLGTEEATAPFIRGVQLPHGLVAWFTRLRRLLIAVTGVMKDDPGLPGEDTPVDDQAVQLSTGHAPVGNSALSEE